MSKLLCMIGIHKMASTPRHTTLDWIDDKMHIVRRGVCKRCGAAMQKKEVRNELDR